MLGSTHRLPLVACHCCYGTPCPGFAVMARHALALLLWHAMPWLYCYGTPCFVFVVMASHALSMWQAMPRLCGKPCLVFAVMASRGKPCLVFAASHALSLLLWHAMPYLCCYGTPCPVFAVMARHVSGWLCGCTSVTASSHRNCLSAYLYSDKNIAHVLDTGSPFCRSI